MFTTFANPARFMALSAPLAWTFAALALGLLPWGVFGALVGAPAEQDQGEAVRILFVHAPSAWLGMFAYALMGGASFTHFVWRHTLADVAARAAAPLGAGFAFLTLATGSIWGKTSWGAWWVWDGRLTSMLILFLLYLGYMALRASIDDERQAARAASILCLVGLVNLPVVKFSVDWWSTLHQPASVFRLDGPTLDSSFLQPLAIMGASATLGFLALWLFRMRADITLRKAESLERLAEARA